MCQGHLCLKPVPRLSSHRPSVPCGEGSVGRGRRAQSSQFPCVVGERPLSRVRAPGAVSADTSLPLGPASASAARGLTPPASAALKKSYCYFCPRC